MSFLSLTNVTREYGDNENKRIVLNSFTYDFPSKGLVGIIGKSGSGKSTLLNMIALLDKPTKGIVLFQGKDINKFNKKRQRQYRSKDIGIVFQHYNLIEYETALYNIILPYLINGGSYKKGKEKAVSLLESIGIRKDLYEQKVYNLSGGEKERIAILRALINDPSLLLADEPTGALDTHNSEIVMKIFKELSKERLIIMVSHNVKLITKYADVLIEIKDGKIKK